MTSQMIDPEWAAQVLLSAQRRSMAEDSPEAFAHIYLNHYFQKPPSRMHKEIFDLLQKRTAQRGCKVAVAAPRAHAKSTIVSLAYVLWCICYRKEPFILLISDTATQANDYLAHVKRELESDDLLQEDFPDVCEPKGSKPGPPRWRQDDIRTRNGVRVLAFGAGKSSRGLRSAEHRPSLVIMDDLENQELVLSADRREKLDTWLHKTVLKLGDDRTNYLVIGTVMHYDALLARLVDPKKSPGWRGRVYRAVEAFSERGSLWARWQAIYCMDEEYEGEVGEEAARAFFDAHREAMLEGTRVLWPEKEDYYALMKMRLVEGEASFDSEKQNEPINPADCLFKPEDMRFWDDEYNSEDELLAMLGEHAQPFGGCDPSMGKPGRNRDDSAIITLLRDRRTGINYVVDADIERRSPDELIDMIIAYHGRRRYQRFAMESNSSQEFIADQLIERSRKAGSQVPVEKVTSRADKIARIQSLEPMVKMGTIRFSRKHRPLLEQLRQFPKAAHDDGPDALEMAVSLAKKGCVEGKIFLGKPRVTARLAEPGVSFMDMPTHVWW